MVPRLQDHLPFWKICVDDNTFTFFNVESITFVLEQITTYHRNLKFTHELQKRKSTTFP